MKLLGMYKFTEFSAFVSLRSLQLKHETDIIIIIYTSESYTVKKKNQVINVIFSNTADNFPIFTDLNINLSNF